MPVAFEPYMSAEVFSRWLAAMKLNGKAPSDAAAGRAIGIQPHSVIRYKTEGGADYRTALACNAALYGLSPYDGHIPDAA